MSEKVTTTISVLLWLIVALFGVFALTVSMLEVGL